MMDRSYADLAWEKASALLAIDSPTGFTRRAAEWVREQFLRLGYDAKMTNKGGVLVDLGGPENGDGLLLAAHTDTLGAMVAQIKGSGRLRLRPLGGMSANNGEAENVRIYTREGRIIEGTLQLCNPSIHVNDDYASTKRSFDTTEVVLDEVVNCAADAAALGIQVGDIVCFDPRTRRTASGYLKSRFLDDKLSVGILLAFAAYLKDRDITPGRHLWIHVTVYEEVGHGACASVPDGISEAISVDMGCVGDGLQCTEQECSICAMDSRGPYNYDVVGKLIDAAKRMKAGYAVDIYPHYGSDVDDTLKAGADIRHGLIGAGIFASHGYERTHIDGVYNTLLVLQGYLEV
ncbi:MAG: M42 family metallopeptidase [Oscillospiraceae bacterium]|nr:M42 family metallopeptidase [Oscillospiraceae bacterium]